MYWNVTIQLFKLIARLAVDWAGFFRPGPGWANSYPKVSAQAGLMPYCILQKPAQAKMGQIFWQLLFQNGPILGHF